MKDAKACGHGDGTGDEVSCGRCDAICCRLTVVLDPDDRVPGHLTARTERGLPVMARDEEGWCVAVDPLRMCCTIYDQRPAVCRKFAMGGPYCREIRTTHHAQLRRGIPLTMY
ncbi:YkgJ family cysteine cluster protein [Luteimonas sp. SJ-92]|uniref:YkgJ family cysteine cluster protein n=1 Tax=Luteimonas salinisoli TaxID=2752307 RepID=A0A853JCT6_9GAMM|nr:YkgJ family cysteine cluster protein [Luteimonas salinisoli]NZA27096.1 YkgJ family cysteine cluster protein [Luteimonas salinisoli]